MTLNNLLGNTEPQAGPANTPLVRHINLGEFFENMIEEFFSDTGPLIFHSNANIRILARDK